MNPIYTDIPPVAIQVSRGVVVASVQVDLDDAVIERFREDLLQRVHQAGSSGVIVDLSGLETLDCHEFAALRGIITASRIMGAESVLVGMKPGVVSALIDAGADVDGLRAAVDLDAAFAMLQPEPTPQAQLDIDDSSEVEANMVAGDREGTTGDSEQLLERRQ